MTRKSFLRSLGALAATALLAAPASAQNKPASGDAAPTATPPTAPVVAEAADRLLKEMAAYIGSAEQFTFHADISFDHVLPSGQKVQFSSIEDVALKRPRGLYVEWNGDLGARQFWYDGSSITLYDPSTVFYASESAPAQLDQMLENLLPRLNFSPPLADLLYSDPYKAVRGNLQYGFDLGQNNVGGRSCRTFAFVEKDSTGRSGLRTGRN